MAPSQTSIFLLPLLDKHHVQKQINEGFSAAAGEATQETQDSGWWCGL